MRISSRHNAFTFTAILLFAATSAAVAANDSQDSLAPITVKHSAQPAAPQVQAPRSKSLDCTPPNDAPACTAFHVELRRHFNERELGMLFGSVTSDPAYLTSYSRIGERYQNFLRDYKSSQSANAVAIK